MPHYLSCYDDNKARPRYFSYPVLIDFILTPRTAKDVLKAIGFLSGIVYQDNVPNGDGTYGTLAYRVFVGGRTKRFWWSYEETPMQDTFDANSPAQRIRAAANYR